MKRITQTVLLASCLSLLASPMLVNAAEEAPASGKKMSCKEEAKQHKFKTKADQTKFMKDCKAKHKAAKQ